MSAAPIIIEIDEDLKDLIPEFLDKRREELVNLRAFTHDLNFQKISELAHKIKGNSGGYGFFTMSDIGAKIENAAGRQDLSTINQLIAELETHFKQISIKYI